MPSLQILTYQKRLEQIAGSSIASDQRVAPFASKHECIVQSGHDSAQRGAVHLCECVASGRHLLPNLIQSIAFKPPGAGAQPRPGHRMRRVAKCLREIAWHRLSLEEAQLLTAGMPVQAP